MKKIKTTSDVARKEQLTKVERDGKIQRKLHNVEPSRSRRGGLAAKSAAVLTKLDGTRRSCLKRGTPLPIPQPVNDHNAVQCAQINLESSDINLQDSARKRRGSNFDIAES